MAKSLEDAKNKIMFQFHPGSIKSLRKEFSIFGHALQGFNSTLVLLKAEQKTYSLAYQLLWFQFHPGSIKSLPVPGSPISRNNPFVSIPPWFY